LTRPTPEIVLVDFGMGNLRSVARALERTGAKARVTRDPDELRGADRLVLPGVGACGDAMGALRERDLVEPLREHIAAGRPYLGICLGLHVLLERGEEGPTDCLGVIPGSVARFPASLPLAVPHMGWNKVECTRPHPVLADDYFYFVHAYRPEGAPDSYVLARTEYGGPFISALGFDACVAVQFHPEKSQRAGLALLERFCAWSP
jgi:glutamine amidotransferase